MANDERETPQELFNRINSVFHFEIDLAANTINHKCPVFLTKEIDALKQQRWEFSPAWCNPPYSRGQLIQWISKAANESCKLVMILPCDSSTKWFHLLHESTKIFFIQGRVSFGDDGPAKFGSILGLWRTTQVERIALAQIVPGWWT